MRKFLIPLVLMATLLGFRAQAFYYWDGNGTDPGAGSAPSGTWGVDAYWNDATFGLATGRLGTGTPVVWHPGYAAAFAAGIGTVQDATTPYTVTVDGNIQVSDIHVDYGDVTLAGGSLDLRDDSGKGANRLFSVGGFDPNTVARYNTSLTSATNIIRYKRGTLILGATNTYSGSTTIEGGVLQLGAPQVIPPNSDLILINNTTNHGDYHPSWQFTPSVLATDGFSQHFGTLQLAGTDPSVERIIDLGDGASAVVFADSSANDWGAFTLKVANYTSGADSLRFGTSGTGLTPTQLGQIHFVDFGGLPGVIDSQGYVTPLLPKIVSASRVGNQQTDLTWTSVAGHNYRIQYKDNLSDASWTDVVPDVPAVDVTTTYSDAPATVDTRFYRVIGAP